MEIFQGLTAPKPDQGIQDAKVKTNLTSICRFLDELLLKSKKFGRYEAVYIGDSWRITTSGTSLVHEHYEGGAWVVKNTITV